MAFHLLKFAAVYDLLNFGILKTTVGNIEVFLSLFFALFLCEYKKRLPEKRCLDIELVIRRYVCTRIFHSHSFEGEQRREDNE